MAGRRMFSRTVTESAMFLKLCPSAQALYFHLGMNADDDGVVEAFTVSRLAGSPEEDLITLAENDFIIILNDHLVSYITDWHEHNIIRLDRKKDSKYINLLIQTVDNVEIKQAKARIEQNTEDRKKAMQIGSLPYSFTYKIKQVFFGKDCPVCGVEMWEGLNKPSIQHNIPISKGGKHELENISIICHRCNVSIRNKETGDLNSQEVRIAWEKIIGPSNDSPTTAQVRLGKVRLEKINKKESNEFIVSYVIDRFNKITKKSRPISLNNPTYHKLININIKELKTKYGIKEDDDIKKDFDFVLDNQKKIADNPKDIWSRYELDTLLAKKNYFKYREADPHKSNQEPERPRGEEIR